MLETNINETQMSWHKAYIPAIKRRKRKPIYNNVEEHNSENLTK